MRIIIIVIIQSNTTSYLQYLRTSIISQDTVPIITSRRPLTARCTYIPATGLPSWLEEFLRRGSRQRPIRGHHHRISYAGDGPVIRGVAGSSGSGVRGCRGGGVERPERPGASAVGILWTIFCKDRSQPLISGCPPVMRFSTLTCAF